MHDAQVCMFCRYRRTVFQDGAPAPCTHGEKNESEAVKAARRRPQTQALPPQRPAGQLPLAQLR